jgi:hypothetical protein
LGGGTGQNGGVLPPHDLTGVFGYPICPKGGGFDHPKRAKLVGMGVASIGGVWSPPNAHGVASGHPKLDFFFLIGQMQNRSMWLAQIINHFYGITNNL